MIFQRIFSAAACAAFALSLPSCSSTGPVEAENPTISQMDQLDVQWGLPPRKARGAPKRSFQYRDEGPSYSAPSADVPARETVNAPPPAAAPPPPEPQLDPGRINSLR